MNGGEGFTGQSPSAACRSVWQTPLAAILTSTSPGPGVGMGTSSIVKGLPKARTTAAFMVFGISTPRYWSSDGSRMPLLASDGEVLSHSGDDLRLGQLVHRVDFNDAVRKRL
jgi:hypothetical protein